MRVKEDPSRPGRTEAVAPTSGERSPVQKQTIFVIGTSTRTHGGIGYVIKTYLESDLARRYRLVHVVTHSDGTKLRKLLMFLRAVLGFCWQRLVLGGGIAHIHSSGGPSFVRKFTFFVLAKVFRCRVILHIHSGGFAAYYRQSGSIVRRLIRYALRSADLVVVLTEAWEKEMREISGDSASIRVIGNPIDTGKYDLRARDAGSPRGEYRLLFLGAIIEAKGVYDIIRCLKDLEPEQMNVRVTFAGDREIDRARGYARSLGVESRVEFTGWVPEDRKLELLRESDVLLLPSYAEGLPLAVLEALACGVPVICSSVGGLPDLITDRQNGLLVKPGDVPALKDAIVTVLRDSGLRERMRAAGRETITNRFSVEKLSEEFSRVYTSVTTR